MEHKVYRKLTAKQKRVLREEYIKAQNGLCFYCGKPLNEKPPERITEQHITWYLFPPNFLGAPIHLQHNHNTGLTEGAVHAYCNAVMWEYEDK
jgi:hypothetical protein